MPAGKPDPTPNGSPADDDDYEEIGIGLTEENMIYIEAGDVELELTPQEARDLAQALIETADEAEGKA